MLFPNAHSFLLVRKRSTWSDFSSEDGLTTVVEETQSATVLMAPPGERVIDRRRTFLRNEHSFLLVQSQGWSSVSSATETLTPVVSEVQSETVLTTPPEEAPVGDTNKRSFLKVAGIAGAGLVASQLFPNKASALIMGSSPTTGVVGVKNASNVRINPATEETVSGLLKASDLTFDTGSLQVKVTSLPAAGNSFSDSLGVAKSGLVDADRHVQVDVLSSTLPSSASTETTLQTISFGGFKFTLRLATVGDVDYVGEASIGTATSAAAWRIKKVDSTTGIILQWAGTGVFDQVWDSRATLSYS
jgi:hypothetical protein